MPQVTIYLKDEILAIVRAAAKSTGISQSKWIAEAVRLRAKREWPASVVA
ncbi:MAG: ribbon-helix-helix protein, CopG family, partial [Acidobacteriaceae bacterium]|nr:ribbon-helix-helix protein, CopG family [Acidobacteriaceae bacterium]